MIKKHRDDFVFRHDYVYNWASRTDSTTKDIHEKKFFVPRFKIGQHIRLKKYGGDVKIIDITEDSYIFIGGGRKQRLPFKYEDDWELLKRCLTEN